MNFEKKFAKKIEKSQMEKQRWANRLPLANN